MIPGNYIIGSIVIQVSYQDSTPKASHTYRVGLNGTYLEQVKRRIRIKIRTLPGIVGIYSPPVAYPEGYINDLKKKIVDRGKRFEKLITSPLFRQGFVVDPGFIETFAGRRGTNFLSIRGLGPV
jgi:hypothetical protein